MPPGPPKTLAPAASAKNAFGILFSPPNRKNAARSLQVCFHCAFYAKIFCSAWPSLKTISSMTSRDILLSNVSRAPCMSATTDASNSQQNVYLKCNLKQKRTGPFFASLFLYTPPIPGLNYVLSRNTTAVKDKSMFPWPLELLAVNYFELFESLNFETEQDVKIGSKRKDLWNLINISDKCSMSISPRAKWEGSNAALSSLSIGKKQGQPGSKLPGTKLKSTRKG